MNAESSDNPLKPPATRRRAGHWVRLRKNIMAGLTVIAPVWITGVVLLALFRLADGFSAPLIRQFARRFGYEDFHIPGLGFVLTFAILWLVGALATNVVGRRLVLSAREALLRLPLVRSIYSPLQQLIENMTSPEKAGFKKVVLVEYPRIGMWTLGFVAGDVPWTEAGREAAHSIFVPTAPNPTTGFMLIVPQEQTRSTALSIEEAFQMIVSAGVVVPDGVRMPPDRP